MSWETHRIGECGMPRAWASRIGKVGPGMKAGIAVGLTAALTLVLLVGGGWPDGAPVRNTATETAAPPNSDSTTTTATAAGTADGTTSSTSAGTPSSGGSATAGPRTGTTGSTATTTGPTTGTTGSTATTTGPTRAITVPTGPNPGGPTPNEPATNSVTPTVVGTVQGEPSTTQPRPTAVTNLTATAGGSWSVSEVAGGCGRSGVVGNASGSHALLLMWDQVCGVSYRISYNGQTHSTTKDAFVVTGLAADTSYTFTVTPYTSTEVGPSSTVTARTNVDNAPSS